MSDEVILTWRSLAAAAERSLREQGFDLPNVDARRMTERASGFQGAEYQLCLDERPTTRAVLHLNAMLSRRLDGEPLQYVVGVWGFRTLELVVDRRALIPRPETEVVVEHALAEIDRLRESGHGPDITVVDLGTGTGAIALSIAAERDFVNVWATDVSGDALDLAGANLAGIGRAGTRVRFVEGSWFDALPTDLVGDIDVLVSNPPYIAADEQLPIEVCDWEPQRALVSGETGLEAIDHIIGGARNWLAAHGSLVIELAPHQVASVRERLVAEGIHDIEVARDLAGRDRVIVARLEPQK